MRLRALLRLSAAILDLTCRVEDRLHCPFHRLLRPLQAPPAVAARETAPGP